MISLEEMVQPRRLADGPADSEEWVECSLGALLQTALQRRRERVHAPDLKEEV